MLLRRVAFPDFCEPCLPSPASKPPGGSGWLHEVKHDGFRMLVRRDAAGVRLFTRNGHDWSGRFPLIAAAANALKALAAIGFAVLALVVQWRAFAKSWQIWVGWSWGCIWHGTLRRGAERQTSARRGRVQPRRVSGLTCAA